MSETDKNPDSSFDSEKQDKHDPDQLKSVAMAMNKTVDELNELAQKFRSKRKRSTSSRSESCSDRSDDKNAKSSKSKSRRSRSRSNDKSSGSDNGRRRSRERRRSTDRPQYNRRDGAYRSFGRGTRQFNRIFRLNRRDNAYSARDRDRNNPRRDGYAGNNNNNRSKGGLSERFRRLTYSALNTVNDSESEGGKGQNSIHFRFPFFALTNQTQIPTATLYRQAKEIVIVIERKLPKDHDVDCNRNNINYIFDPERSFLYIDHKKNLNTKMQFSNADNPEAEVIRKISAVIQKSGDVHNPSKNLNSLFGDGLDLRDLNFHPLRGQLLNSLSLGGNHGFSKLSQSLGGGEIDPMVTPKNNAYFLHDDRMKWRNSGQDNRRYQDKRRYSSRHSDRDSYRSRRRRSSPREESSRRKRKSPSKSKEGADKWGHDKYYEIEKTGEEKVSG